jgi:hypothetical protein
MSVQAIFGLQFILSALVFALLAKWVIAPRLDKLSIQEALFWLTIPHAFRHIGLVFLVPGVIDQPLPESFDAAAAYGDLASGLLAVCVLIALRSGWTVAIPAAWALTIVGTADLVNALRQADAIPDFGAAWYIPTFLVPLLLVTHYMSFVRLVRPWLARCARLLRSCTVEF